MTEHKQDDGGRRWSRWRVAAWSAAALVLLIPLIAMQFSDDVDWTAGDFIFAALLLISVGIPFELVVRKTEDAAYRAGAGVALVTAFLLLLANGAVGIIGSEDDAVNLLYHGVLTIAFVGTLAARFRARGLAYAMAATALAQAAVAVGALVAGLAAVAKGGVVEVVTVNGFFVALWAGSAALFREAVSPHPPAAAGPRR